MSENEVIFMRFRNARKADEVYLVGCSERAMRKDALLFGPFSASEVKAEILTHDEVAEEASRRCFPPRIFREAVDSARSGIASYYLFG